MMRLGCETISKLQWIDAGFAFAAASFWLWASLTEVPDSIDHFITALRKQSRLNAAAAICAGLAAALQAFLIVQPTCVNL
jgi:hypothetical protein